MWNAITDVPGIEVGHLSALAHATGCTVVLCRQGAVGGVDVRGSAPGTRETDLLRTENLVDQVHAVLLSGGSAYGLAAASGVLRYLEERSIGHRAGPALVPIVPAAILFDLGMITDKVRPGDPEGYRACPRDAGGRILDSFSVYADPAYTHASTSTPAASMTNTTIGVVATSATLTKGQANKLAQVAHDGLAMAIRPCHTLHDGDVMFALATGHVSRPDDMHRLCGVVPHVVAQAVVRAVKTATGLAGVPSWKEVTDSG